MKSKLKDKNTENTTEYMNIPSWDEVDGNIDFKDRKKFNVPNAPTEKEKLDEIEEKVENLQPKNKKGKRKKIVQIFFLLFCTVLSIVILALMDDSGAVPLQTITRGDNFKLSMILMVFVMVFIMIIADSMKYVYLIWVTTKKFRPFISFKVGIVGRYYDGITPLATGGQPFQMYYLAKRDVPVGVASSIPILRFILGQFAILIIALGLMFFVKMSPEVLGLLDETTFKVTKSAAYVMLVITCLAPMFVLFLTILPNLGKKATSGVIKLGCKLKFIKNYETTYNKVIKHVDEFQTSMRYVSTKVRHITAIMLFTFIEYIAFLSIPYFICLAFGSEPSWQFYLSIITLNIINTFAVSLMPTPGTAGAAETVFLLLFKNLFPIGAFWAMLIWRFMTYYIFIILGLIVNFYDFVKQATKEKFIERRKYFNIREKLIPRLNSQSMAERLANLTVLKQIEKDDKFFIPKPNEKDIKIMLKTEYSQMPYKPAYLAYKLHEVGCVVAGIMDNDTLSGANEFIDACKILDMKALIGVEVKTYISRNKKKNIRINNINQKDIINLSMTCIPQGSIGKINDWLSKYRNRRNERNKKMMDIINKKFKYYGIVLDFEEDILSLSRFDEGGTVTEWHLIYALANKLIERFGRGQILLRFLMQELHIPLTEKMKQNLLDVTDNKIYGYDVANTLQSEIKNFYIDADDECCSILEFIKMAKDTGSVVVYRYVGDIIQYVMGEYRVEKFEDSYLDELISEIKELGINTVAYEPSRLTEEQLQRIGKICNKYEMLQISGETLYSARQNLRNDVLENEKFEPLINNVWALVGNMKAMEAGKESGIFSPSTVEKYPQLSSRIMIYSSLGRYGKYKEN